MKTLTAVTLGGGAESFLGDRPHPHQRRPHGFRASSEGPDCSCGAGQGPPFEIRGRGPGSCWRNDGARYARLGWPHGVAPQKEARTV